MKIAIAGTGYVGLSNAVVIAQHHEVIAVDVNEHKVDLLNQRISPILDAELTEYLATCELNLTATLDATAAYHDAEFVIVATPTNYDEVTDCFDTSTVEQVVADALRHRPDATIVIKSTVPVGFTTDLRGRHPGASILFSPEFLREGRALHDNLHPARIVVGSTTEPAHRYAALMQECALDDDIPTLFTGSTEAEARESR